MMELIQSIAECSLHQEKLDKLKKRLKSAARVRIAGTAIFDIYAKTARCFGK